MSQTGKIAMIATLCGGAVALVLLVVLAGAISTGWALQ
jgi:hypothetical protein